MTVANNPSTCPLCGGSLGADDQACPNCLAVPRWRDLGQALIRARDEFTEWRVRGLIGDAQGRAAEPRWTAELERAAHAAHQGMAFPPDTNLAPAGACWRCARPVAGFYSYCNTCGAPQAQAADTLRYLEFLAVRLAAPDMCGLTLTEAHACLSDVRGHIAALRSELERGRLDADALAAARLDYDRKAAKRPAPSLPQSLPPQPPQQPARIPSPSTPRRRAVMEILLDPRSIQWLQASGGVLLVAGLVIWLASLGIFKDAIVVAICMGAGTLGLLAGGCTTIKLTRHRAAGRAITLLAALVMPLNLWFYHRHGLLTLEGHLWVAALVCCALYAAAATVLEDPVFVYALSGGIAMTGLMILADMHRLMEIASPSTLLIVLGLIALHAERAFADNDSPFSRKRFGLASFWSAQALLGSGLLLLLGSQISGLLPPELSPFTCRPDIVTDHSQRFLAICLVLAGAYAYLYSDLVVRRVGIYVYFAAFTLVWGELLALDFANFSHHPPVLIAAMAITSLLINIAEALATRREALAEMPKLARPLLILGVMLSMAPVLMGVLLHIRATSADVYAQWPYHVSWAYVISMLLTAICCRVAAFLFQQRAPKIATAHLAATAAVTLVGAAGLLTMLNVRSWPMQSPILMLIPILYLTASRLYAGRPSQKPFIGVAYGAAYVLLIGVLFSAMQVISTVVPVTRQNTNLLLALFSAEAAIFYIAAAVLYGGGLNVYLASGMACCSVWQLLNYRDIPGEYYCITFAALGMAMLIAYRMAMIERVARPALVLASFRCANSVLSLSLIAALFMAMSRLAVGTTDWLLAILLGIYAFLALVAAALVRLPHFRRWYITVAVTEAIGAFFVIQEMAHLSPWQHLEVFCVSIGSIMLLIGYSLWYREQERQSDGASFCLMFGSILAGLPLAIAAIVNRFGYQISLPDELALATISTLMFVSGFMCRIRATTLVGGALLVIHLAMLLVFVGMRAQLAVGVYVTVGGVLLFGLGVILSLYRDRLLALPQQVKEREGLFKVLAWR